MNSCSDLRSTKLCNNPDCFLCRSQERLDKEKKYMHINTGSVDSRDGWCCSDEDFNHCLADGSMVEVEKVDGQWVEVE